MLKLDSIEESYYYKGFIIHKDTLTINHKYIRLSIEGASCLRHAKKLIDQKVSNIPVAIISNGHGGMIAGKYQTRGKRSPIWSDGSVLYEGEFNRAIKNRVIEMLHNHCLPYYDLVPEQTDVRRPTRIKRANDFHRANNKNTFLLEIHSNAGGGEGCETFMAEGGSKKSLILAECIEKVYQLQYQSKWRGIKRKNFDMVYKTHMPAGLVECFFMDTEEECKSMLMTKEGRDGIAMWMFVSVVNYILKVV
jgi:N-acetylmuramoyl-L-alanine amidase